MAPRSSHLPEPGQPTEEVDVNESTAHPAHPATREERDPELYRTRGHEIRLAGEDLYLVPSCTGEGSYSVDYREETCDCPDFLRRHENCKHILAVGVLAAKRRRRPCACDDGWVTTGQMVVDPETGEEVEEYALYLCRRCASEAEEEHK
jgi:hypothetical protein